MVPIWKDYYVDLGAADAVAWRIRLDDAAGEIIYAGKAYIRPDAASNEVRINDICADWFDSVLTTLSLDRLTRLTLPVTFYVEYYDEVGEDWTEADTVQFLNDWSYDDSFDPDTMPLSAPIDGILDCRQLFVYTAVEADDIVLTLTFGDGTSYTVTVPIKITADFNDDFNDDFARSTVTAGAGTAMIDLSPFSGLESVSVGDQTWKVGGCCATHVLYYLNAYGGWDSFVVKGNSSRTDALERYDVALEYDNRDAINRGRRNYLNEVKPTWALHTGLLSDDAAGRMHHLLESTDVYLYDVATGVMRPVVLTNAECEYKAYRNGRQPIQYTITAEVAQEFVRR